MRCTVCFGRDGVITSATIQTQVTNDSTGVKFNAFVCERCLTLDRITRVTCRTFKNLLVTRRLGELKDLH
jgi:hypothetical protein